MTPELTPAEIDALIARLDAMVAAQTNIVRQHLCDEASVEDIGQCAKQHWAALHQVTHQIKTKIAALLADAERYRNGLHDVAIWTADDGEHGCDYCGRRWKGATENHSPDCLAAREERP